MVVTALFLVAALAALVVFIVGFSRHGVDFVRHGFRQKGVSDLGEKIDSLDARLSEKINNLDIRLSEKINNLDIRLSEKMGGLREEFKTDLEAIKVNHFGHLKDFLTELTSILLDKGVINNQDKARLDNKLRDM